MTIQECYRQLGGDFALAQKRLTHETLIKRFIVRFLDDDSFSALSAAMERRDPCNAFLAAHSLKGVSGSLCLGRLFASASHLTELFRTDKEEIPPDAFPLFEQVKQDYQITIEAIRAYQDSSARPEDASLPLASSQG